MKPLNKQLWYRALDRAVPETYTTLSGEQLGKAIDVYTELIVRECAQVSRKYADKGICSNHYDEVGIECLPSDMEYYVLNYFGVEE